MSFSGTKNARNGVERPTYLRKLDSNYFVYFFFFTDYISVQYHNFTRRLFYTSSCATFYGAYAVFFYIYIYIIYSTSEVFGNDLQPSSLIVELRRYKSTF